MACACYTVEDAATFKKPGLAAILVYPMNALANDQEQRIRDYLEAAGLAGAVTVAKYDRGTSQAEREKLRKNPPHILLTNYMMLEYLLVRPADREDIFDKITYHLYRIAVGELGPYSDYVKPWQNAIQRIRSKNPGASRRVRELLA